MADTKNAPFGGYGPDMDGQAHEATYRGFVRFIEIGVSFVIFLLLVTAAALAVLFAVIGESPFGGGAGLPTPMPTGS